MTAAAASVPAVVLVIATAAALSVVAGVRGRHDRGSQHTLLVHVFGSVAVTLARHCSCNVPATFLQRHEATE